MPDTPAPQRFTIGAGQVLAGRYRLDGLIATGGMAQVWRATDQVLRREVAVKILHPHLADEEGFIERFRTEAVAAARLGHPSIVSIFDTCTTDGVQAIVMELVRGRNLRHHLDEHGPLSPVEAVRISADVADALASAHRAGLVHRDIKPANILLWEDGRVMVTDFGIAKMHAMPDVTRAGTVLGSVKYLAPEQVDGSTVDPRTDVYALGAVLYESLCGRPPFKAETDTATALARLQGDPPRPRQIRTGIPRPLDDIVMRALARSPDHRFSSAAEFRAALLAAPTGEDPTASDRTGIATRPATPAAPRQAAPSTRTERRWLVPALVVLLVALAVSVAAVLIGRTEAGQDLIDRARQAVGVSEDTRPASPVPIPVVAAQAFDPQGTGTPGENNELAAFAIDGDAGTSWRTERYEQRTMGPKDGVGLLLDLGQPRTVHDLTVSSPTQGWAAQVYVAPRPAPTLEGWGTPVVAQTDIRGDATFDLADAEAGAVLFWITDLGDAPPPSRVEINEVQVLGTT